MLATIPDHRIEKESQRRVRVPQPLQMHSGLFSTPLFDVWADLNRLCWSLRLQNWLKVKQVGSLALPEKASTWKMSSIYAQHTTEKRNAGSYTSAESVPQQTSHLCLLGELTSKLNEQRQTSNPANQHAVYNKDIPVFLRTVFSGLTKQKTHFSWK